MSHKMPDSREPRDQRRDETMGRFAPQTLAELEISINKMLKSSLGFVEDSSLKSIVSTIQKGGGEREIAKKLTSALDDRKADKVAGMISKAVDDFCISRDLPTLSSSASRKRRSETHLRDEEFDSQVKNARKRHRDEIAERKSSRWKQDENNQKDWDDEAEKALSEPKVPKLDEAPADNVVSASTKPAPMTAEQIKAMMANTMAQIGMRKKELDRVQAENQKHIVGPKIPEPSSLPTPPAAQLAVGLNDKAATLAALQARIAAQIEQAGIKAVSGPTPVILDDQGRTVDAAGQQVQLSQYVPTLKANLRAKKRDELKENLKEVSAAPSAATAKTDSKFFDPRVAAKQGPDLRAKKKAFKFNDPGKFQMEGKRLRMKAQLEKLQGEIATISRKTGISSATQLAKLVPKDADKARVPDIEWWDALILENKNSYPTEMNQNVETAIRKGAITNLIEHPIQLMPLEPQKVEHIPVFLTKKERKKLRRQNRREAWKEKQDKIRLGLIQPDEAKVKMSNLMRVLGTEAVQDPTKVEAHVRSQMAKRKETHEKANAERKLTPEQKKEKMIAKLKEDTTCGVHVGVYRVKNLANPSKKFKVETNAKQLYMTGAILVYEDVNVVVVEGGPKAHKKFKQLMLRRIKWGEETYKDKDNEELDNDCALVWEGQTKDSNFGEIKLKICPTESFARDFFKNHKVEHYWDAAYSGAVLEASEKD